MSKEIIFRIGDTISRKRYNGDIVTREIVGYLKGQFICRLISNHKYIVAVMNYTQDTLIEAGYYIDNKIINDIEDD